MTRSTHTAEAGAKDSGEGLVPLTAPPGLCPHLGSRKGPGVQTDRPSRRNVCHVQERVKIKGFRKVTVPYSPVPRDIQAKVCMVAFTACAAFREHAGEEGSQSHPRRSRGEDKYSRRIIAKRWQLATQLGAAFMVCAVVAVGLFLFLASNPGSFIEYIQMTIVKNEIKAFGMRHLGLKDKFGKSGGLVTGGQMRALKNMSASAKKKLKNSSAFKGMSRAQKDRLRKQFSGR